MPAYDPKEREEESRPGRRHAAPIERALDEDEASRRAKIDAHEAQGEALLAEADAQAAADAQADDREPDDR